MTTPERPAAPEGRVRRSFGFLVRYGIAGGLSALTHLGTTWLLVELFGIRAVLATNVGFACSVGVSYTLQRSWVFRSARRHREAVPRFLTVVAIGATINLTVMAVGTELLDGNYVIVQLIALVAIPVSNLILNATWTFRTR